jgi:flavin-dependent dehydrogenase
VRTRHLRTRPVMVDVLVAGGGPAGAAAAAAAHAEGLEVELLDASGGHVPRPGESLPPGTETVLDELFGTRGFHREHHRPSYGNRSAWGDPGLDAAEFMLNPLGHGWHVDRRAFDASLLDSLRTKGVRVREGTRVTEQSWSGDCWDIALEGGHPAVRANAIVDATGRAARIARSQGARRRRLDRLVAAYWLLEAENDRDGDSTTLVEAVADGWWYTTPVPARRRVVAFLTDADLLPPREARTARAWNERLALAPRVREALADAGCRLHASPRITDAAVAHLDRPAGPGWVAAGDAAVSFDPLSSQGILTALLMGGGAGRAVVAMLSHADPEPLVRYGAAYAALLEDHCRQRAAYYGLERRWPSAPFWARRPAISRESD